MEEGFVWKTRDAAEELLIERKELIQKIISSTTEDPMGSDPDNSAVTTASIVMPVRNAFDVNVTMHRLSANGSPHNKSPMVRKAFQAAASCVLQALVQQEAKRKLQQKSVSSSTSSTDQQYLPDVFQDWKQLEEHRRISFDRSHHNKEYGRKVKKVVTMAAPAPDATHIVSSSSPPMDVVDDEDAPAGTVLGGDDEGHRPTPDSAVSASSDGATPVTVASVAVVVGSSSSGSPPTTTTSSSSSTAKAATVKSTKSSTAGGPKFTRNTPASSAAALDFRFNSSRAILCAAGNLVFESLTPPLAPNQPHLDALSVPQNPSLKQQSQQQGGKSSTTPSSTGGGGGGILQVNMGAVVVEAQTISQRTIGVVENAVRRSNARYMYRKTNALHKNGTGGDNDDNPNIFLQLPNPYAIEKKNSNSNENDDRMEITSEPEGEEEGDEDALVSYRPNPTARTNHWTAHCLPRFLDILKRGAGHAIYHDYHWKTRHGRLAHLLHELSPNDSKFGPHLIVTIEPEVHAFGQEFENGEIRQLIQPKSCERLRVLTYSGSHQRRKKLRQSFFAQGDGLETSPWHVMVASYSAFLQDFLHFSQVPFNTVILDDGLLWMSAAQGDVNSALGSIWENIFAKNDQQIGLAGTINTDAHWNFGLDGDVPEAIVKDGWVGLTCRHRIMTSSAMAIDQARGQERVPVSGLLGFVAPHFADVVREEWDRSRITTDANSMAHFRLLVARSTVAHYDGPDLNPKPESLAIAALNGKLESRERSDPMIPEIVYDDAFVSDGKINFSRRSCLSWLGKLETSWLRYELGKAKLQHILDAMKISNRHGHICEEITTASSTTSSGATGQVAGSLAYRLAIRCGRHFGSEQGLRQHVSALHAPPGTWLCRTCGSDCITSQARTHHERSCGATTVGAASTDLGASVGATPTVGQGAAGESGVGKKKTPRSSSSQQASTAEEKDPDGSLRVPGYRGVWVSPEGKHFIKIDGKRFTKDDSEDPVLFDNIDDAARKHDELLVKTKKLKLELNFKPDGSRVIYDDITPSTASGLGGSATSVVPALSIINIKDLPPDVKPLLRDPRQTSRTGGNSKRHVYAYRGVCRQARKGHDRWQSQISFMGVNHYLGTFDSEWDAAAIYGASIAESSGRDLTIVCVSHSQRILVLAWAHLILYGEEATKQAQKEGEEAAAAYEREQQDIAAGKLPEASPRQKKKTKPPTKKPGDKVETTGVDAKSGTDSATGTGSKPAESTPKKRKSTKEKEIVGVAPEKKTKTNTKACKLEKEAIGSTVAKGVTRASVIAPKEIFEDVTDDELLSLAATKIKAVKENAYCLTDLRFCLPTVDPFFRPCLPQPKDFMPLGGAILHGLSPTLFEWDLQDFVATHGSGHDMMTAIQMLAVEYDDDGANEKFMSVMQGSVCILGRASDETQEAYKNLGLGPLPMGASAGRLDCNVGGVPESCSEIAASIRYAPKDECGFWFSCLSDNDVVTLNGEPIRVSDGSLPLYDEDVCSVGARVFVFITPQKK